MIEKVFLASPRGFCAGVVRAIDVVEIALKTYPNPVYVRKEIVHNSHVVKELSKKGAIFVDSIDEIPIGQTVVFSAHGVSPEVWERARSRSLKIVDATCPLVTKVHDEAVRYAGENYTIVLIGHPDHDEVIGTMGEAPENMVLVSSVKDVEALEVEDVGKVAYVTQTTLSLEDTREIIEALRNKFTGIQSPPSDDICYATQNRQMAVKELAKVSELILVVGTANSSNSNRLVEEAQKAGCSAHLINDQSDIVNEWLTDIVTVGVTSGASAPERLVSEVVSFFQKNGAEVEEMILKKEEVHFALPSNLLVDLQKQQNFLRS